MPHAHDTLTQLRVDIDAVDRDLIKLIARRMELARQVGAVKRAAGLPALDLDREASVLRHVCEVAREEGAPEEDVRLLFTPIIELSRRVVQGVQVDRK